MAKIKTANLLYITSLIILIFIFIGYFSIRKNEKAVITNSIDAVPLDAAFIVETPNINNLIKDLKEKQISKKIIETRYLKNFYSQISDLDTILRSNPELKSVFSNTKILISEHTVDNKANFLISCKIYPLKKQKKLLNAITKISQNDTNQTITYSKIKIFSFTANNKLFYYSIVDNILIISKSLELEQAAIRQKQSNNPISLDLGFKQITSLSSNLTHLYINYKKISDFINIFAAPSLIRKAKNLKNIACWSGFDASIQNNLISLNGLTFSNSTGEAYLDMFAHSKPQKFDAQEFIPAKTAEFLFLASDNYTKLYSKYEKFISSKNLLGQHKIELSQFKNKYKIKPDVEILHLIKNYMIFVKTNFNNSINKYSYFLLLKTNDTKKFKDVLLKINENIGITKDQYTIPEQIDNSTKIEIYKLDSQNLTNMLFGKFFNFPNLQYFTIYKNFIIFGSSSENLKHYYSALYQQKTLANNPDFTSFQTNTLQRANIFYFSNNEFDLFNILNKTNTKYQKIIKQNLNYLKKLQFVSLQYSYDKNKTFTTELNFFYNDNPNLNGISQWETELYSNVKSKPLFFINHYTFKKEIFICDTKNIVYLIDRNGKILWKKQLNEDFRGIPYMLDLYNNSKYQLVFATSNHIVTLDRNGKAVPEKIAELPDSTRFGISVYDYSHKKDYRIFVPCINKVYLYDKNMKKVDGWKIPETETPIVSKVYYFNYNGKDYLVFGDKSSVHIVNRRGEDRINVKQNISLPNEAFFFFQPKEKQTKASFVTTDASGNIIHIDLNGNVSSKRIVKVSKYHTFTAVDLNNDKLLDYIFTEANTLMAFNSDGKTIFTYTFDGEIKYPPLILKFSDTNIKIGIVIPSTSKVYIFNSDGSIYNNFPVQGNSLFSVGHLSSNTNFSLIVGHNNYLNNYLIF